MNGFLCDADDKPFYPSYFDYHVVFECLKDLNESSHLDIVFVCSKNYFSSLSFCWICCCRIVSNVLVCLCVFAHCYP